MTTQREHKWPNSVTYVRHIQSGFQAFKAQKAQDPDYVAFRREFKRNPESEKTKSLATIILERYRLGVGDHNIPTTETGRETAQVMAGNLKSLIKLPNVIYVSPYGRTLTTLEYMQRGWPALRKVKVYEDDRLRELDHGLANAYNDWRVFFTLHPEQRITHDLLGDYWYRWPQGENIPDVRERSRSMNTTFIREFAGQDVLVISHHLYLLSAMANHLRWDAKRFLWYDTYRKPINSGVTMFKANPNKGKQGRLELEAYNQKLY